MKLTEEIRALTEARIGADQLNRWLRLFPQHLAWIGSKQKRPQNRSDAFLLIADTLGYNRGTGGETSEPPRHLLPFHWIDRQGAEALRKVGMPRKIRLDEFLSAAKTLGLSPSLWRERFERAYEAGAEYEADRARDYYRGLD